MPWVTEFSVEILFVSAIRYRSFTERPARDAKVFVGSALQIFCISVAFPTEIPYCSARLLIDASSDTDCAITAGSTDEPESMLLISFIRRSSSSALFCASGLSTDMRIEFLSSSIYPCLSIEPISAFTATSQSTPLSFISSSIISASELRASAFTTVSFLFTLSSMLGFTSMPITVATEKY